MTGGEQDGAGCQEKFSDGVYSACVLTASRRHAQLLLDRWQQCGGGGGNSISPGMEQQLLNLMLLLQAVRSAAACMDDESASTSQV
jgi:hypothetical protein